MIDCKQVNSLWDEYRDGTLSAADAHGLEEHLAECEACEILWRKESQWMSILAEKSPVDEEDDASEFSSHVLAQWKRESAPAPVLARIGKLTSIAAAIALFISFAVAWQMQKQLPASESNVRGPVVAQAAPAGEDPVQIMFKSIDQSASKVRNVIDRSNSMLDVDQYVNPILSFLEPEDASVVESVDEIPSRP